MSTTDSTPALSEEAADTAEPTEPASPQALGRIVPCPPALHGAARRGLDDRLRRALSDLSACHGTALELGDAPAADRILEGVAFWRDVVADVARRAP